MKKLLIILCALSFIAGCSNDNPFANKNGKNAKAEKKEAGDRDKGESTGDNYEEKDPKGSWSSQFRRKQSDLCMDEYRDDANAKQICNCILEKMERQFPDEAEAKRADEDVTDKIIDGCENNFRDELRDDGGYVKTVERNDFSDERTNARSWSSLQRQTFIQGCATEAQRTQGFTAQQATSYCDCMTRKVEQKYSFKEAAKLTAADFATQEWINSAAECRSRIYQLNN